jgi:cytidine deaminase
MNIQKDVVSIFETQGTIEEDLYLEDFPNPEIFIGLVGAVGTDLGLVCEVLEEELNTLSYNSSFIRMSELMNYLERYQKSLEIQYPSEFHRIDAYMKAGDDIRQRTQRGEALALLAISEIRQIRKDLAVEGNDENNPVERKAYIFKSLKQPEEINKLRKIYGNAFTVISIYSPREERLENLERMIKESSSYSISDVDCRCKAERLIHRDEFSGHKKYGQNVREAFPLGDVFIRMEDKEKIRKEISRFLKCWFGYPFHTPLRDEHAMFHAMAASLRSADLSRQVGAVICNDEGEILVSGCNEVPKALGGCPWEGDFDDHRDFRMGQDSSTKWKKAIVSEILKDLKENDWLSEEKTNLTDEDLVKHALFGNGKPPLKGDRITSLLEFGRVVHAEMNALMEAVRRGISVKGATLYCTTFPCHMCARHIIASGIKRVVFIEPYPKSMAKVLYPYSIRLDGESERDQQSVIFEPFVGIAPFRYFDFFGMFDKKRKEKQSGKAVIWEGKKQGPKIGIQPNYIRNEIYVGAYISGNTDSFGVEICNEEEIWVDKGEE